MRKYRMVFSDFNLTNFILVTHKNKNTYIHMYIFAFSWMHVYSMTLMRWEISNKV